MEKKGYIVSVGKPWDYVGYDFTYHVFEKREDAERFFDTAKEEEIQDVIDMNGLLSEDEAEYREEVADTASYDFAEDPDGAWQVRLDECVLHTED